MKDYCDLHTHSSFSDGTCTPSQLIQLAEENGLAAIALCDWRLEVYGGKITAVQNEQ